MVTIHVATFISLFMATGENADRCVWPVKYRVQGIGSGRMFCLGPSPISYPNKGFGHHNQSHLICKKQWHRLQTPGHLQPDGLKKIFLSDRFFEFVSLNAYNVRKHTLWFIFLSCHSLSKLAWAFIPLFHFRGWKIARRDATVKRGFSSRSSPYASSTVFLNWLWMFKFVSHGNSTTTTE